MNRARLILLFVLSTLSVASIQATDQVTITVAAGDNDGLINAIHQANNSGVVTNIVVELGPNGETGFVFDEPAEGSDAALPVITGTVVIGPGDGISQLGFRTSQDARHQFRLMVVEGSETSGNSQLRSSRVEGFGSPVGSGGAILVAGMGALFNSFCHFTDNQAAGEGGALAVIENGRLSASNSKFTSNMTEVTGGAVSARGAFLGLFLNTFEFNSSEQHGCDLNINMPGMSTQSIIVNSNNFNDQCGRSAIDNAAGEVWLRNNSFATLQDVIRSTGIVRLLANLFLFKPLPVVQGLDTTAKTSPQVLCNDFGTNAFFSLGFNVAEDESCALNEATDQEVIDAMTSINGDGIVVPDPGSVVIDAGGGELRFLGEDPMADLPCHYKDMLGNARPQDGNNDGTFECDAGAVEVVGDGEFTAAHSGAFFNPARNGEGIFVENLGNDLATIYTFTYRPDGSGPAWFIGVGGVKDNAVIIDENLRPAGTSFGDQFNAADIELNPAGSMSFIVPDDCTTGLDAGIMAFAGDHDSGYEDLLSDAVRVSKMVRCVDETENVNVGLSGSWFDPNRSGEGLIVQWLDFGDVLVIFFTYDENGDQMWMIGQGTPEGKTVTMDALYPAASTRWGTQFVPGDVSLQTWGEFTLTWSECHKMTFDYTSEVGNYGSASREYIRLSTLAGTECPDFLEVE